MTLVAPRQQQNVNHLIFAVALLGKVRYVGPRVRSSAKKVPRPRYLTDIENEDDDDAESNAFTAGAHAIYHRIYLAS